MNETTVPATCSVDITRFDSQNLENMLRETGLPSERFGIGDGIICVTIRPEHLPTRVQYFPVTAVFLDATPPGLLISMFKTRGWFLAQSYYQREHGVIIQSSTDELGKVVTIGE